MSRWWKRWRESSRRGRRVMWARDNWSGFRLGYMAALDDIERTGLRPKRRDTQRQAADRALRRLIDGEAPDA